MPFGVRLFAPALAGRGGRTRGPPVEHVRDLAVTPDFAFVLDGAGLEIRAIDDPVRPRGRIAITGGERVVADGAIARVTFTSRGGDRGVVVVDARDPDAPIVRATTSPEEDHLGAVLDVVPWGRTLVCTTPGALVVIDPSDPERPREASRVDLRDDPLDLAIDDGVALVASGRVGVRLFDLCDPGGPVDTGTRLVSGDARSVDARDGRAWVLEGGRGVRGWDPKRREKGAFVPFRGVGARVRAWGPHLLVASRGLVILPRPD